MRRIALVGLLGLSALPAGAEGVRTGAGHDVVHVPPQLLPVRGPRFAAVTIDLFVAFGHQPSMVAAELVRRYLERSQPTDVREVLHLSTYGAPLGELAVEAAVEAAEEEANDGVAHFWPFCDRVLNATGPITPGELARLGREAGLDGERLDGALASRRHLEAARGAEREVRAAGHGPPEESW